MSSGSSIAVDSEIGVTKADKLGNQDAAAGSFTGEIDVVTKADELVVMGNKEAAGTLMMVTEKRWIDHVFLTKPPPGSVPPMAEPTTGAMITKERVPQSFIDRLKDRPVFKKLPPLNDTTGVFSQFPKMRDQYLTAMAHKNYCIDLHEDVLRQHAEKGFAEVGVNFTDGVKKICILPQPESQATMQQGNGGGGRSKTTTLVGFSGFAILFASLVVLLSCLLISRVNVQV